MTSSDSPPSLDSSDKYDGLKWRVDVVLSTNEQSNIQEPKAALELKRKQQNQDDVVAFEMSRSQVAGVLKEFDKIQRLIHAHKANTST
ncbi:hypothetical protein LEN26_013803 [Aphanomyces euteiches]|uniref:COMM domain-containing protein n=1 Tax=Aphanomyces euteiches TaxID=100861 RepID=A0A6G0X260_9STRA|nr:hypothetical protein Ae201684_009422 [Aphanomyces euteiches]KAH9070048.1 hypothetical protein Ae201684P_002420 [Aphanomyces euteiches]KAH9110351.1 hypothetical protein LEN26_013803 [Aphanomyces euteiches]KAH9116525.1 hypothetical protein AeMF1_009561 [Aphanomyces euteiches]KAH9190382.1 hypothetical protein AeNC1_007644 [Aphanomyces euteiches]